MIILLLISCAVKHQDKSDDFDSDGDLVNDQEELNLGRGPLIADIPTFKLDFISGYQVAIGYREQNKSKKIFLTSHYYIEKANFSSPIGPLAIRHDAIEKISKMRSFKAHHSNQFPFYSLNNTIYSGLNPRVLLEEVKSLNTVLKQDVYSISIQIENRMMLEEDGIYQSIKNPTIVFSYYDHKKGHYINLESKKIKKDFYAGENKPFSVFFKNVPSNLIFDNYIKRGDFIIAKLVDFEIPELKTTYQELLRNIQKETIPVVYSTPLQHKTYYVSLEMKKKKLSEILKNLFEGQVYIEEGKITQIGELENDLDESLQTDDRIDRGQWFVLTTPIEGNYLNFKYSSNDAIGLFYITQKELSHQRKRYHSAFKFISSDPTQVKSIPLGNIGARSEVFIKLEAVQSWGEVPIVTEHIINSNFYNLVKKKYAANLRCEIEKITFAPYRNWYSSIQKDILSYLFLAIEDSQYNIKELVEEGKISLFNENAGLYLHIKDVSNIHNISEGEDLQAFIDVSSISITVPQGAYIKYINKGKDLGVLCINEALNLNLPISISSMNFESWESSFSDRAIEDKTYHQNISLNISVIAISYYD